MNNSNEEEFTVTAELVPEEELLAFIDTTFSLHFPAYSRPSLPLIPDEACHPFHANAATDSEAKLPPWQRA